MLFYKTIAPTTLELLIELQKVPELTHTRLVGGTALALQIGHRISVDLDLFAFDFEEDFLSIIAGIKKIGYSFEIRRQTSNILISMINNIKVDIVNYPYPWLDNKLTEDNISLASIKDIAAMKLSAITNRGTKKDFIDLYYLLKQYSLKQLLELYDKKYSDASTFMVLKSLTYFEDAEDEILPNVFDHSINWEDVKKVISNEVMKLS